MTTPQQAIPTRARIAWALFDWANSAYATLIVTFVFSTYFALAVVGDPVRGQQLWGWAASASGPDAVASAYRSSASSVGTGSS